MLLPHRTWFSGVPIGLAFPDPGWRGPFLGIRAMGKPQHAIWSYWTPSFFCRLVDEVVYWNTSF